MKSLKQAVTKFTADESGQDLIEYALLAGLIALGAVASIQKLANSIDRAFAAIAWKLTSTL